ncbi:DUF6286 domain-containing protein [Arthrobacter sp. ISL-95]|uniref:DUF6286 domain-containing protein n=1 Tax=Arthrobacter sp. ISL-95 TaxID=2819116 RepID=UPI001BE515AD|nr:DUF6286 domain-containing protein [Arthrobacter sp. ISL-95]MBT2586538.1 hypothetical protein [Arthrobacter sp. ISL-95]
MSRHDGKVTPLRHRPSRAIPALILGTLLLAAGVALVWAAVARLVTGSWPVYLAGPRDWLTGVTWNDPGVWAAGAAATVLGFVLLAAALVPGRFNAVQLQAPADGGHAPAAGAQEIVMTRRAIARYAAAHCEHVDGVRSATATASARAVHLNVTTALHETGELRARVIAVVTERLTGTGLNPVPKAAASVRSRE